MSKTNPQNIPVFILAGGLGTRLSEETAIKPKPMVEIGDTPILIHIMRWYYRFGFNDFVICAGYKSWEIKNYFLTYSYKMNHLEWDNRSGEKKPSALESSAPCVENWRVRVVDTGEESMTGSRLARAFDLIEKSDPFDTFAVTYGDGLSNVDLESELAFHKSHGNVGTVLTVRPKARFGELEISGDRAIGFMEKPQGRQPRVNGGYFFFENTFRKYLSHDDSCTLERSPLENLAKENQLRVYSHDGFWFPIDTLSDKNTAQALWESGEAPWQVSPKKG